MTVGTILLVALILTHISFPRQKWWAKDNYATASVVGILIWITWIGTIFILTSL